MTLNLLGCTRCGDKLYETMDPADRRHGDVHKGCGGYYFYVASPKYKFQRRLELTRKLDELVEQVKAISAEIAHMEDR